MRKCVITVLGKDTVGIIAKVCSYLAENNINILEISQTIVAEYFNMVMIVDVTNTSKELKYVTVDLTEIGEKLGVAIHCQREEIFEMMHRL